MKIIFFLLGILFSTLSSFAQAAPEPVVKFNTVLYDFGKIKQGIPVTCFFELTNISKKPVVVERTWTVCGCTIPDNIREPIMPGKTVKLRVVFNAAALGGFHKGVYIKLAGKDQHLTAQITGEVLTAEAFEKQKNQ